MHHKNVQLYGFTWKPVKKTKLAVARKTDKAYLECDNKTVHSLWEKSLM